MNTMNIDSTQTKTQSSYIRINISVPKDIVDAVKNRTANVSKYISEATSEKIRRDEIVKAMEELRNSPPTFQDIEDPTAFIRELRAGDEERMKRLGV